VPIARTPAWTDIVVIRDLTPGDSYLLFGKIRVYGEHVGPRTRVNSANCRLLVEGRNVNPVQDGVLLALSDDQGSDSEGMFGHEAVSHTNPDEVFKLQCQQTSSSSAGADLNASGVLVASPTGPITIARQD
jgi:hypothetical protein